MKAARSNKATLMTSRLSNEKLTMVPLSVEDTLRHGIRSFFQNYL